MYFIPTVLQVLQQCTDEYQCTLSQLQKEIEQLTHQADLSQREKALLESQNQSLTMKLEKFREKEKILCDQLQLRTVELQETKLQMTVLSEKVLVVDKEHVSEVLMLQTKIKEQSDMLKEYQDKVCKHCCR